MAASCGFSITIRSPRSSYMAHTKSLPILSVLLSPILKVIRCRPRKVNRADWSLTDRQERITWWCRPTIQRATIFLVGCGGLGSNILKMLVQIGVRLIDTVDEDVVEDSNRNRQNFVAADV